jgi:TRAP-type transport system periplasmic protein
VQAGGVYLATYQALGAIPVTIDSAEMYTALSQRTVDGIDLTFDSFTTAKLYTVCKHIALSNHVFNVSPLIGSKRKIETLPPDLQRIVREEGRATGTFWRSILVRQTAADLDILKRNGIVFTEIQHAAFRKAVEPVYALVQGKLGGDLIERIARAANST